MHLDAIKNFDKNLYDAIIQESVRQHEHLELIASENFVSKGVMEAAGSILTNKYAEGYPGKRYYGGCEYVDIVENLARDRMKEIFDADHANVQPHSGSNANLAVYLATLSPGDTVLGMNLTEGGHLTHGSPVNISGIYYNFVAYGVDEDEILDYEDMYQKALEHKPKMIIAGASAYPREIDFKKFREVADEIGALLLVDMAHIAGLVAAGEHQNPVKYADFVTTTTHKTLRGPRGGAILTTEEYANAIDKAIFPGSQGGPLMHIIAAKAVCFKEALEDSFKEYIRQVKTNASVLADTLQNNGIRIVSGGTDSHLVLLDLTDLDITGRDGEAILEEAYITTNKNTIPRETRSPFVTSGIRIGTSALTSRGMKENEMKEIGNFISSTLKKEVSPEETRKKVLAMVNNFPIYK